MADFLALSSTLPLGYHSGQDQTRMREESKEVRSMPKSRDGFRIRDEETYADRRIKIHLANQKSAKFEAIN